MFSNLDVQNFVKDMQNASEKVMKEVKKEQEAAAIEIVSDVKVLLNSTPGAGGKMGRIVTGRLINSYHWERSGKTSFGYRDNKGQSFKGDFTTEKPTDNTILIGSNVVYADIIEQMDGTFKQAFDKGAALMVERINKILS
jgi:phage gpG-like protein